MAHNNGNSGVSPLPLNTVNPISSIYSLIFNSKPNPMNRIAMLLKRLTSLPPVDPGALETAITEHRGGVPRSPEQISLMPPESFPQQFGLAAELAGTGPLSRLGAVGRASKAVSPITQVNNTQKLAPRFMKSLSSQGENVANTLKKPSKLANKINSISEADKIKLESIMYEYSTGKISSVKLRSKFKSLGYEIPKGDLRFRNATKLDAMRISDGKKTELDF